jgi:glycosyltransferase involved in cell wall biosynthesis
VNLAIVNLTGGGLSRGYVKYLRSVVPLLAADPRVHRLEVGLPPQAPADLIPGVRAFTWPADDAPRGYRGLKARIARLGPDVLFIPTARWLDAGPVPTVVMVRNMEPLTVPFAGNTLLEGAKNLARAHVARVACRRATRVLAVSEHVRDFLALRWNVPREKIGVVYHGVEPPGSGDAVVSPAALAASQPAPFLFTAGSIRPARGLDDAIRALALTDGGPPLPRLVIAGQPDTGTRRYQRRMAGLAGTLGVAGRVVWTGQLTPPEMAWCFRHCEAFVMTSRAEACPNVALEAMSHGCRVVSTGQPPMPEFFGEAARYYRAGDAIDLARAVRALLGESPEDSRGRREAARTRAAGFRWPDTADRTIGELTRAVAGGQREGNAAWTT